MAHQPFAPVNCMLQARVSKPESHSSLWGNRGKERGAFQALAKALLRMDERDRKLLLKMAQGMARRERKAVASLLPWAFTQKALGERRETFS
jgi:hypothetical protein